MTILKTPLYGIEYSGPGEKPRDYGIQQERLAKSVETALALASIPPTGNPDIRVATTAAARNAHFGTPTTAAAQLALQNRGATCIRPDQGWTERYYAAYSATNPGGARGGAGWYPVDGAMPTLHVQNTGSTPAPGWVTRPFTAADATLNRGGFTFSGGRVLVPFKGEYEITALIRLDGDLAGSGRAARLFVDDEDASSALPNIENTVRFSAVAPLNNINLAGTEQVNTGVTLQGGALGSNGSSITGARLKLRYLGPV